MKESTCPNPSSLTETSILAIGATLGWTDSFGSNWDVYVVASGSASPVQGTTPTANDLASNSYSWTNGDGNTAYDWYVRSDCDNDNTGTSMWVGPSTFSTDCNYSTPWSDDVEDHTEDTHSIISNCWSSDPTNSSNTYRWNVDGSGSTPSSDTGPSGANSGSKYFYVEASDGSNGDIAYLYTPEITITSLSNPELEFYYHMYGSHMGTLHVDLYDGSWHNDIMIELSGEQQTANADAWRRKTVNLDSYTGTIQIRFRAEYGDGSTGDISLDDISVKENACPSPTSPVETSIIATGANLGWTDPYGSNWDVML